MKEVLIYLENLLTPGDTIVVATSGGPDSMCLLHLLCELKEKLNLKLIVAHVNHKVRSESEAEAVFVKNVALQNHLEYEYMEILEYAHDNFENEARSKRYAFFEKLIDKYHAKYLMTAHHGDDLMETILMRLVRGSSLKGYSGFHILYDAGHYKIIRPLITLSKKEIQEYMDANSLKYVVDESNFSDKITRNRYRKYVLPFLKNEQVEVHKKFLKFSEELNQVNTFLDNYIKSILPIIKTDAGYKINELLKLEPFLLKKVVEYSLSSIYVDDLFLINDRHTELIIGLIKSNKSNASIKLPNGYTALKSYNYYKIVNITKEIEFSYILDKKIILPNKKVIKVINSSEKKSNYVIRLNSKDIVLPIIVRSRCPGDTMEVKNLHGHKKIKDILIDEKIDKSIRDTIPVVTDAKNNILWLPSVKKSKFDVEKDGIYDIILSYEEEC